MLKLGRRARGHFVTLIEIRVHLIRVKPGHISNFPPQYFEKFHFLWNASYLKLLKIKNFLL